MGLSPRVSLPSEAVKHERHYEWGPAARCYRSFLEAATPNISESLAINLRLAHCLELAANQTNDLEDSRKQISEALTIYREIEQRGPTDALILVHVAKAHRLRLESMLSSEVSGSKRLLDEAMSVNRGVLEFLQDKDGSDWMSAGNFQLRLLQERFLVESEATRTALLQEAIGFVEELTTHSNPQTEADALGEAYYFRLFFTAHASEVLKEWSDAVDARRLIVEEALDLVPRIQDKRVLTAIHIQSADSLRSQGLTKDEEEVGEQITLALETARATRDLSLIGQALELTSTQVRWKLVADSQEQADAHFWEIHELFEEGRRSLRYLLDPLSQDCLTSLYADIAHSHSIYATNFVTDRNLRRQLLEEDVTLFREGMLRAERTASLPKVDLGYAGAEAIRQLAALEADPRRRTELLQEGIRIEEKCVILAERVVPIHLWSVGIQYITEASLRVDLAQESDDRVRKMEMLATAIDRFRVGLSKVKNPGEWLYRAQSLRLSDFNFRFVKALGSLFDLTRDHGLVDEQLSILDDIIRAYTDSGKSSRVAEALWQKASIRSKVGQHREAADEFGHSAESYQSGAKENPSLKELYIDLSLYMQAWSQIETARSRHSAGVYGSASEAYQQASTLLKSTQRWFPLGEHYAACAVLEEAEVFSHEEDPKSSAQLFAKAADLLESSAMAMASWTPRISGDYEPKEKIRWQNVIAGRKRYCTARADLEGARLLDRNGDHRASGEGFGAAAAVLEDLMKEEETSESKREISTLALICRAWQSLKEAEAAHSADKYGEAAHLFEQTSETATSTKTILTARGNTAFCYALQSGTSLRLTRETELYPMTKKYLETAANYYTEAGLERAASWTRGTQRTFDGLVYLARAEGELQAPGKAESYSLAERSFEVAAKFYREAGYTRKEEQASRYLKYAREQKLVFISPAEALDTSVVLQQSKDLTSPELTRDQPLGIESFETANVQVKLVANRSEITLGESLDLLVEVVSAGRFPATLVKVTDLAPAGLKVETIGEKYRVEGNDIALKGRRLEPFDTVDLHMRITPTIPGDFKLRPRILYLSQDGQYRQSQPEPILFGALAKETTTVTSLPVPELETSARTVFDYLVKAFIEDYMNRKLQLEQAGWRSMPQVAEHTRISRSSLYGTAAKYGRTITDLLSKGLIETRISTGHRGRGGVVVRLRIAYDKEPVKRHVDRVAIGSK